MQPENNSSTASPYAELYPLMRVYFLSWFPITVILIGVVGSGTSLALLLQRRLFPAQVNLWLVSIALGDILVLVTEAMRVAVKGMANDFDVRDISTEGCRAHVFLCSAFNYWSALCQAAFSLQRFVAVYWPTRARMLVTPLRARLLWLVLVVVSCIPNTVFLVRWSLNPQSNDCEPDEKRLYFITTVNDLLLAGILPVIAMIVSTVAISMRLFRQQRRLTDNEREECNQNDGQPRKISVSSEHLRFRERSSVALSRLLVLLNVWYFVTTCPCLVYLMYLNFGRVEIPQPLHKFVYYLLRCLFFLNAAFNWAFYLASGRSFRRAWLKLWLPVYPLPSLSRCNTNSSEENANAMPMTVRSLSNSGQSATNPAFETSETNLDDDDGVWR